MKKINVIILFIAVLSFSASAQTDTKNVQMKTELDSISNALGVSIGKNIKGAGIDSINVDAFVKGITDALGDKVNAQQLAQAQSAVDAYVQKIHDQRTEMMAKVGKDFLAANKKRPGVVTLPSGLQYEVITEGSGVKPIDGDQVTTHYTGSFVDGRIFDSSVQRGEPATFGVNQVIKGWTEALKLMPEGSKWKLYIPYDLAYGDKGSSRIPGYSTLVFDIELLDVVGK